MIFRAIICCIFFGNFAVAQSWFDDHMGKYISVERKAIPPDFGKDAGEVTIFVLSGKKNYDKNLREIVAEHYKGPHVFATKTELKVTYDDLAKYRFLFVASRDDDEGARIYEFVIRDRKTEIFYTNRQTWFHLKKVLTFYIQQLELKRQHP